MTKPKAALPGVAEVEEAYRLLESLKLGKTPYTITPMYPDSKIIVEEKRKR